MDSMVNADGLKTGATVAVVALGLLFAGQVLTMTVRWVSRALSGAILILLPAGVQLIRCVSEPGCQQDEYRPRQGAGHPPDGHGPHLPGEKQPKSDHSDGGTRFQPVGVHHTLRWGTTRLNIVSRCQVLFR